MQIFECPDKCGNIQFDLEEIQTNNRDVTICMVRCHGCGKNIGIFDKTASDLLYEIKQMLTAHIS
jgi:hypothetical protein